MMKTCGININGKWVSADDLDVAERANPAAMAAIDAAVAKAAAEHLGSITGVARDVAARRQALVDSISDPGLRAFAAKRVR
jgi:hypothetical protein